jgi:hypothetical protein
LDMQEAEHKIKWRRDGMFVCARPPRNYPMGSYCNKKTPGLSNIKAFFANKIGSINQSSR